MTANQLRWKEKDTRIAADNIKLHSELAGDVINRFIEYFEFAIDKIDELKTPNMRLPKKENIHLLIKKTINVVMKKRLGKEPDKSDIENMIEGERIQISQQIAKKIGKLLDKSLYKKFKSNK
mgnify:FL=1